MQIQRLVDLEDYEFDTLLVTYNHKNRLSLELGKVSEIFESLQMCLRDSFKTIWRRLTLLILVVRTV